MKKNTKIFLIIIAVILVIVGIKTFIPKVENDTNIKIEKISYSDAREKIESSQVDSVELLREHLIAKLYSDESDIIYQTNVPSVQMFCEFMQQQMLYSDIKFDIVVEEYNSNSTFSLILSLLTTLLPAIMLFFIVFWIVKLFKNKDSIFGPKEDDIISADSKDVSFNDVAGIDNERAEVEEVVSMLKNPEKYKEIGAKIPKGILLVGEPGTGKTLIAKAIAGEAGVNFYNCVGSNFDNVYVGVGASKMRKLFDQARKNAPSIIFIDEIDAIARKRYDDDSGCHEQTLNQLLSEMDGFDESTNVIMIAATNHLEVLDPAITRPGRFDRIINIPVPDKKGRGEILEVHARNKKFSENKEEILNELASKTSHMTGAVLENILNEAAIIAVKNNKECIEKEEIDEAFVKVILGISKEDKEVSEREKKLVAIHEAGHTIASRIARPEIEILQVSIIPRGTAGGYNLFNDDDDNNLPTKEQLQKDIIVSLGGRAAEEVYFETISVGASSDLQKASEVAHKMIYKFAMGGMDHDRDNTQNGVQDDVQIQMVKIFGEHDYNNMLEEKMFPTMEKIVKDSYKIAKEIIQKHRTIVGILAMMLLKKSTLDSSELEEFFSKYNI